MICRSLRTFACVCLLVLTGALGCGQAPEYTGAQRFPISGSVSYQGTPIDSGTISLIPEADGSNPAGANIENGKFSVPEVKGPNKGRYRVAVYWYKPTGKKIEDPDTGEEIDEVEQVIPPNYNEATELSTEVTGNPEQDVIDLKLE